MVKGSEKNYLGMIIQVSFVFYLNLEKIKKGCRESKNVLMILIILVTPIIQLSTVSAEKEQSLPSE